MKSDALPARSRGLLVTGLSLVAVTAVLGTMVLFDPVSPPMQPLDDAWRRAVGSPGPEDGFWVVALQLVTKPIGMAVLGVLVPALLLIAGRRWAVVYWLVALGVGSATQQAGKAVLDRERPAEDLAAGLHGPLFGDSAGAFPSGHSMVAGVVLVAGAVVVPLAWRRRWWVIGVILAVMMLWQRTLVNAHWLTDTVGGLALGAGCALILWWAMQPLLARDPDSGVPQGPPPKHARQ